MANPALPRFVRPLLLFVFLLQASKISALDCYGCFLNPDSAEVDETCLAKNLKDNLVVNSETPKSDNVTKYLGLVDKVTKDLKLEMHHNATCFTYFGYSPESAKVQAFRYIYDKKPNASECVDVSDPMVGVGKVCFCSEKKCNSIDIELPPQVKSNTNAGSDPKPPANKPAPESGKATDPKASKPDPTKSKSSSSRVSFTLPSFFLIASSAMLLKTHPSG